MLPFALTIFTGAFLLFQVQPLIGKFILPWFGGGPGVWTTCLLFFQTLLLGGYAYAHFSSTRLKPKGQAVLHLVLLALALALLPIVPRETWKAQLGGNPVGQILLLLTVTLGLPYFVLSSTGPLMQQWFSRTNPGVSPYRLYALSNIGSLLALLSYPVFFEVKFSRQTQATMWSAGLVLFAVCCGYCALRVWRQGAGPETSSPSAADAVGATEPEAPRAPWSNKLLWLVLPAIASMLLLATTNKLCQEIAVIPFLWVLPLALYLVSFIVCFDHARWYRRDLFAGLFAIGVAVVCYLADAGTSVSITKQVAGHAVALFAACMVCHGELYRIKPPARDLTSYYLFIAAGGALGGLLVAVVAPAVFTEFRELQIGLWLVSLMLGVVAWRTRSRSLARGLGAGAMVALFVVPTMRSLGHGGSDWVEAFRSFFLLHGLVITLALLVFVVCIFDLRRLKIEEEWQPRMGGFVMLAAAGLGAIFVVQARKAIDPETIRASRNFYGTLKVFEYATDQPEYHSRLLMHGATTHGLQLIGRPTKATTYYGEHSGVGLAIAALPADRPRRLGLVGLGTGTLASYGREGDYLRIYEINPAVERLAREAFSFVGRSPAKVDVIMGDARLSMEREVVDGKSQQFDLLALDAFSSDAIPMHLLTKESFAIYLKQLKQDGVIAVHISNRYLDLEPVVNELARQFGLKTVTISDDELEWFVYSTTWVLVTRNKALLETAEIRDAADAPSKKPAPPVLWTDDHASLYQILK